MSCARCLAGVFLAIFAALAFAGPASSVADPLYETKAVWGDTQLKPGDTKADTAEGQFAIQVRNIGNDPGAAVQLMISEQLPGNVRATKVYWSTSNETSPGTLSSNCSGIGTTKVTCTLPAAMVPGLTPPPGTKRGFASLEPSGFLPTVYIDVSVPANATGQAASIATVSGGGMSGSASDEDTVTFSPDPAPFGVVEGSFLADVFDAPHPGGEPTRQASDRPFELRLDFDLNAKTGVNPAPDNTRYITSSGQLRTAEFTLPRGMMGNPEALPKCDPADFVQPGTALSSTLCPADTQIGYLDVDNAEGTSNYGRGNSSNIAGLLNRIPLYNLEPPKGVIADFGFNATLVQGHVYSVLDPANEYAIKVISPNVSNLTIVRAARSTVWGVPGDPAHDHLRFGPSTASPDQAIGAPFGATPIRPFITNPVDCGEHNGATRVRLDSYQHPGQLTPVVEADSPLNVEGCEDPRFRFEPKISLQPTSREAGGPTGLDVSLQVPQRNDATSNAKELYAANGNVKAIATPPVKKVVVTFPEGMTLSPSAAQGLEGCTAAQIGIDADTPITCPDGSQYGTFFFKSPALPADKVVEGRVYIAKQSENPFGSFFALYLAIEDKDLGLRLKLPGRVDLDPQTGQIITTFDGLPQQPVSEMKMALQGGVRAALVNPATCGTKTITATFYSWHDPTTPHTVNNSYDVDPSTCVPSLAQRPFAPTFQAGTRANSAGSYSPLLTRITRTDQDQELSRFAMSLPTGLVANLNGLGRCGEAAIARAMARTGAGEGALEQADPSCPAASQIGTLETGAGVGVPLTYVPGKLYLAGPYQGAPISAVAIVPAVVGPYDLGVIAVRTALRVDRNTARASAETDAFPQIFYGIPVRVRDVRVNIDRDSFTLNPTSCEPKQVDATLTGTGGDIASSADDTSVARSTRFQAADCASLDFRPRLSFRLFGATGRGGHPRLKAVLRGVPGQANIAGASVALPSSEFLDQGHIKTVCTRVQFAAKACPKGSIYGHVKAKSPLFEEVFSGPIYLRSSSNPLPDLVGALSGPASLPIEVDVVGRVDSVNGGIRNTFDLVPDVPVSWAVFSLQGAGKGLLVNSTDLCDGTHRATAKFNGQNGKRATLRPELRAQCGGDKAKLGRRRGR